jgi:hypothetical protein
MILVLLLGCQDPASCDDLPDLGQTAGGLVLTADEHPGWGREQCSSCHAVGTYHQLDCISSVSLDLDALGDIDPADPTACVSCHGSNGVDALESADSTEDSGP